MELCLAGSWPEGPLLVSTPVCYSSEEPPFLSVLVALSQYLLLPGLAGSTDLYPSPLVSLRGSQLHVLASLRGRR